MTGGHIWCSIDCLRNGWSTPGCKSLDKHVIARESRVTSEIMVPSFTRQLATIAHCGYQEQWERWVETNSQFRQGFAVALFD